MAANLKIFNFLKKDMLSPEEQNRQELLDALMETHNRLESARLGFDYASEPELVDASVYEINSLQARYSYLLRKVREEGCMIKDVFKKRRKDNNTYY